MNWKVIWDDVRAEMPRSPNSEMGFETSSDSYWTLITLIMLKFEGKSAEGESSSANGRAIRDSDNSADQGSNISLELMPLEADCDSHGAHLRKILGR